MGPNITVDKYYYMCYTEVVRRVGCAGSHHQFKHPVKKGRVTVKAPCKSLPRRTLDSIERQSGLKFR